MPFFEAVSAALLDADVDSKCAAVALLGKQVEDFSPSLGPAESVQLGIDTPGRPAMPELVAARSVPRRSLGSLQGRAALVHAIAHIEFNAINLALDAVWRFRGMPAEYYRDWISVAMDESRHFGWLRRRLSAMGYDYGDFTAHDGLWDMACRTAHDPLLRMALVPRVLEARGLDVTPGMIERLQSQGDRETTAILKTILQEEVGHVAIGTRWFRYLCKQRALEPDECFIAILKEHLLALPKGPFNLSDREAGGFSQGEMQYLQQAT